jgi:hypothetical protein
MNKEDLLAIESRAVEHPAVRGVLAIECPYVAVTLDEDGDAFMEIRWDGFDLGFLVGRTRHDLGWFWLAKTQLSTFPMITSGDGLESLLPVFTDIAKRCDAAHEELDRSGAQWPPCSTETLRADNAALVAEVRRLRGWST